MTMRPISEYEKPIVELLKDLGFKHGVEYAAFLESSEGRLIELRTDLSGSHVSPSSIVLATQSKRVVHHNHISGESLSRADWVGLKAHFSESFAYTDNGTIYWGSVKDKSSVGKVLADYQHFQMLANSVLLSISREMPSEKRDFFEKEVINRAMRIKGFVDYEVCWGDPNDSFWDKTLDSGAACLARKF